VQLVIDSSSRTLGAPIDDAKSEMLQAIAQQAVAMRARVRDVEQRQRDLCDTDATLSRLSTVVGPAAAIAIYADLGDPTTYDSAAALEKACGLNLRETSSGRHQGKLRITKRGPARVRKYLYLAAMRAVAESGTVRAWYERRAAHRGGLKRKALVAVMRKQLRALFHVARGASFDESKLFDLRRLSTPSEEVTTRS
jgi:transposase